MAITPDIHIPDTIAGALSPTFIRRLLINLSGIIAIDPDQDPAAWAEEWQMLQQLFWALKPSNEVEAALAAHAVDAHYRGMEISKRAAKHGLSDETALRLHTSVNAAKRAFVAALSCLEKRQQRRAPAAPEPIAVPMFNAALPAPATRPLNGFANRAARRAAAALARKSARLGHDGG